MKAHPNFEDAMAWLRAGDIDPEPGADPRGTVGDQALNRRAAAFAAVFGTVDGQAVLQTILETSLFRAPVDHRLPADQYLAFAQLRQGQNQLASVILAYLDHHETLEKHRHGHERSADSASEPDDASWRPGPDDAAGGGWESLAAVR